MARKSVEPSVETNELMSTIVVPDFVGVYDSHIVLVKSSNSPQLPGSAALEVIVDESNWVVPAVTTIAVAGSSPGSAPAAAAGRRSSTIRATTTPLNRCMTDLPIQRSAPRIP